MCVPVGHYWPSTSHPRLAALDRSLLALCCLFDDFFSFPMLVIKGVCVPVRAIRVSFCVCPYSRLFDAS